MNHWIIPMDYETYDFKDMQEEWEKNKAIKWRVSRMERKKGDKPLKVSDSEVAKQLKKDDVIFFYITHLPSGSQRSLSRIMLRGVIEKEPYLSTKGEVYHDLKGDTTSVIAFDIGQLTTLPKKKLEDNTYLDLKWLRNEQEGFQHPQGTNWLDEKHKANLDTALAEKLNECFGFNKDKITKTDFKELIDHFNRKCFFSKSSNKSDHKTFVARNGLDYLEYHHFIPQSTSKTCKELGDIIQSPANGLFLCSNCHNKIHYGRKEDVRKMIDEILEFESTKKMLKNPICEEFIKKDEKNKGDWKKWFYEVYKVKDEED